MAPYRILIVIISSVIPENLVLLTKSEQSGENYERKQKENSGIHFRKSKQESRLHRQRIFNHW